MIRPISNEHIERARIVHSSQYEHEFELPDFYKMLCAFSIVNERDDLVSIAGVRPILELVVITDKTKPVRERYHAVYNILDASKYIASRNKYDQLHAFVQDKHWADVMKSRGFSDMLGQGLVIEV